MTFIDDFIDFLENSSFCKEKLENRAGNVPGSPGQQFYDMPNKFAAFSRRK